MSGTKGRAPEEEVRVLSADTAHGAALPAVSLTPCSELTLPSQGGLQQTGISLLEAQATAS